MNKVHIEFQRVQSWLFAVPRLRAMIGANVLLGEALRIHLPKLARKQTHWRLSSADGNYPAAAADDPLSSDDDPAADARDGIISRDGGHFEANFESGAEEFRAAAAVLLGSKLPGLRFRISVDRDEPATSVAGLSTELPVFAPCEWTGRGLASEEVKQGNERSMVSLDVARRHEAAKRSEDGNAMDVVSLLVAKKVREEMVRPTDLDGLAGRGYLAIIHADGNGVGDSVAGRTDGERSEIFHCNRVLLRRAVGRVLEITCGDAVTMPLMPLMLGGDDLLVVSRADTALPFVAALCEELANYQTDAPQFLLTLGVGVVFARPTIPIHRLHSVTEQLVASAKRRFRGFPVSERRSVVDWAVYTASWVDDPEAIRRHDWVKGGGTRVLSRRPVDVLGSGLDSLRGLLAAAEKVKRAPRSQLRYLVEQLPKGQVLSELAFEELSQEARKALEEAGITQVWQELDDGRLLTSVLDLVEIADIERLGRAGGAEGKTIAQKDSEEAAIGKA